MKLWQTAQEPNKWLALYNIRDIALCTNHITLEERSTNRDFATTKPPRQTAE
jgi:hypothetical protein